MTWQIRLRTLSHGVTWWLGTRFPQTIPLTFVLGYPKSGTTWVSQLVADYLQLPFPRYSLFPIGCPAVVHGHELVSRKYPRGVYAVRDGRDAMVSRYFFLLRSVPDGDNPRIPRDIRRFFPGLRNKADVQTNLPRYLEAEFTRPRFGAHWGQHVRSYYDASHPRFVMVRYEDLLSDGPRTLAESLARLEQAEPDLRRAEMAIEKFSFARQARLQNVQDARFLRKGRSGDWRTHFTPDAAHIFDRYAGDMLIAAGYETDHSWVNAVSTQTHPGEKVAAP